MFKEDVNLHHFAEMGLSERQMRMVHPRLLLQEVQEATRAALG